MTTVISVENLSKSYALKSSQTLGYTTLREAIFDSAKFKKSKQRNQIFWALKDLNFTISHGDKIGIIGRNGAGKSTLLKILSRITDPTSGKIKIKGRIASLLEVGTGFHPELSGRENIFLNGAILGMSRSEIKSKFDEIVSFAEVEKFLDTPVKRYSSGMYVKLAFSVAAHLEPEILVVDEVLAVGDADFQRKCLGKMDEVGKSGRTLLFVSHNMGLINKLCEKSILLSQGNLLYHGKTAEAVKMYLSISSEVGFLKSITDSQRNRGGEYLQFKSCLIMSSLGEPNNQFLIHENIRVKFQFNSDFKGLVSFWLIIFDINGVAVLSSHQRDYEPLVDITNGQFEWTYETKNLGLMPGHYYITAGCFDKDINFLEWVDNCQEFDVINAFSSGKPFDGRWGLVDQDANWMVSKV